MSGPILCQSQKPIKSEWEQDLCDLVCEEAWTIFCERYQEAREQYVPKSRRSTKKQKPPWMIQEMLTKLKEKQKLSRSTWTQKMEMITGYTLVQEIKLNAV